MSFQDDRGPFSMSPPKGAATASAAGSPAFRVEVADGVATVWMDVPGEPVNTLSAEVAGQLDGILGELEDGPRGKVAVLQVTGDAEAFVLLALYRERGGFSAVAVDAQGKLRPDIAEQLTTQPVEPEPVDAKKWTGQAGWEKTIRKMAEKLPKGDPHALAAVRVRAAKGRG